MSHLTQNMPFFIILPSQSLGLVLNTINGNLLNKPEYEQYTYVAYLSVCNVRV